MFVPNDTVGLIIGVCIVLLLLLLGLTLFFGHGAKMLAGYNAMSPEERRQYNEKALCRAAGPWLIAMSVLSGVCVFAAYKAIAWLVDMLVVILILGTIGFVVWVNVSGRFKKQ